ncbi:MAG: hypothetical protein ABIN39_05175 [candidate division WOR-3 bacterium]
MDEVKKDIQDLIQKVEEEEEDKKKKEVKTKEKNIEKVAKLLTFIVIFILFIASIFFNVKKFEQMNKLTLSESEIEENKKIFLYLTVMKIKNYKEQNGFLPKDLKEFVHEQDSVDYSIMDDSIFELSIKQNEKVITYNSKDDPILLIPEKFKNLVLEEGEK